MKKRIVILAAILAAVSLAGCGKKDSKPVRATEVETTVEEATSEETEESTVEETQEKESKGFSMSGGSSNSLDDFVLIFDDCDIESGFLGYDKDAIIENLEDEGFYVDDLEYSYLDSGDGTLYEWSTENKNELLEVDNDGEIIYMSKMTYEDEKYWVFFGSDLSSDYEDALPYCTEDTYVEYIGIGMEEDGKKGVLPIIAGTEDSGYYLVKSTLPLLGFDVWEMETPDFYIGDAIDSTKTTKNDKKSTKKTNTNSDEVELYFEITEIENATDDYNTATVYYSLTNGYDTDIYISDPDIFINGKNCTNKCVAFFEAEALDTTDDAFYIDGYKAKAGDEIVISGMMCDENGEDIMEIHIPLTLSQY